MKTLITAPFHPEGLKMLAPYTVVEQAGWGVNQVVLSRQELIEKLQGVDILVTEMERVDEEVLQSAPALKLIGSTRGTPYNINLEAATSRGIPVLYTPGRNAQAVAELTVALMIALARKLYPALRFIEENKWVPEGPMSYLEFRGLELCGKTLGLVGLGAIGKIVARLGRSFDMEVMVYDPYASEKEIQALGVRQVTLETLCRESDFISLHCKVTPETRNMISFEQFAWMKKTCYLVNTARADIIHEEALLQALREGKIAGAALDVFSQEPLPLNHPLRGLPNVLLTPHIGGATHDVVRHHSIMMAQDIIRYLSGEQPRHVVNLEVLNLKKAGNQ
jgi:D-3-phosphoglycerate dehydrogenase